MSVDRNTGVDPVGHRLYESMGLVRNTGVDPLGTTRCDPRAEYQCG
jgi:hypothetical protein